MITREIAEAEVAVILASNRAAVATVAGRWCWGSAVRGADARPGWAVAVSARELAQTDVVAGHARGNSAAVTLLYLPS